MDFEKAKKKIKIDLWYLKLDRETVIQTENSLKATIKDSTT